QPRPRQGRRRRRHLRARRDDGAGRPALPGAGGGGPGRPGPPGTGAGRGAGGRRHLPDGVGGPAGGAGGRQRPGDGGRRGGGVTAGAVRERTDVDFLQGDWELESRDGRPVAKGELRATFRGEVLAFRDGNGKERAWNFALNLAAEPRAMDLSGEQPQRAIYR